MRPSPLAGSLPLSVPSTPSAPTVPAAPPAPTASGAPSTPRAARPAASSAPTTTAPPAPTTKTRPARTPRWATEHQRSRLVLFGALGSFAAACLLGGGACSIALGHPAPADFPRTALLAGLLACALALVGAGLLLALRERDLRRGETRRASRAEQIRRELDALGLTPRETTVAELILQHRSYDDIAAQCGLSPRTVQFHASNIFRKAYVTRRRDFERLLLTEGDTGEEPYERIRRLRPREDGR